MIRTPITAIWAMGLSLSFSLIRTLSSISTATAPSLNRGASLRG
jgi:hypothetical protein